MADHLPDCVIASSNRFNDIGPYAQRIYTAAPKIWGSVFPWEFPQKASREEEERFLRNFFSDTEIHMQGGAHGEGRGYRFLKQVWYCNALWNFEERVPAVENWFWDQPVNMSNLNDPEMCKFFLDPGVKPSTFFETPELNLYGEKFLAVVVPFIQETARKRVAEKEVGRDTHAVPNGSGVPGDATDSILDKAIVKAVPRHPTGVSTAPIVSNLARDPQVQRNDFAAVPDRMAQDFAPAINGEVQRTYPIPREKAFPPGPQRQAHKRGNSNGRRFSNRGGHFPGKQPLFNSDRGQQPYPSPVYGAPPMPMYNQNRGPSGGSMEFMPSVPQGQHMPNVPLPMQQVPAQFANAGATQYPIISQAGPYGHGQQPIYYSNTAFNDRSNDYNFSGESYGPNNDFQYDNHRGARRNSQGGRGRGYNGTRGRGSRGRNSFTGSDVPRYINHGGEINAAHFDAYSADMPPHARRNSVFEEANWRSGSDRPQTEQDSLTMKENMLPKQAYTGPVHHQEPQAPYSNFNPEMRASYEHNQNRKPPPDLATSRYQATRYSNRPSVESGESNTCGRDWISPDCTIVKKLVAFGIPESIPLVELGHIFGQYGQVTGVNRAPHRVTGPPKQYYKDMPPIVFITFDSTRAAREFLNNNPAGGFGDHPVRVEVAREYWQDAYTTDKRRMGLGNNFDSGPQGRKNFVITNDNIPHARYILRPPGDDPPTPRNFSLDRQPLDETQSGDTTPTPSGATTPKGKNKSNKKSGKKKKDNDLRRVSLAATADQHQHVEKQAVDSDAASIVTVINKGPNGQEANTAGTQSQLAVEVISILREASAAEQAEFQTSTEPSFTPTEEVKTQLPVSNTRSVEKSLSQSAASDERPLVEEANTTVKSQITVSPPKDSTPQPPHSKEDETQLFREKEAAVTETQAAPVDVEEQAPVAQETVQASDTSTTPHKAAEDQVDDSFHIASGTPGRDKVEHGDEYSTRQGITPAFEEKRAAAPKLAGSSTLAKESAPAPVLAEASTLEKKAAVEAPSACPVPAGTETGVSKNDVHPADPTTATFGVEETAGVEASLVQSRPKVTISTTNADGQIPDGQSEQRSTSGNSIVPPTPAFVTAPNTPAFAHDTPKEDEEEVVKPATTSVTKAEKPKGPAKTESLSLFGKKRDKKPRPSKKGSIRGKPSSGEAASGSSSRAVSRSTTPGPAAVEETRPSANPKKGGEDMMRADSKTPVGDTQGRGTNGNVMAPSGGDAALPQAETPSKRRGMGFGNIISGFFGGGQQAQPSLKEAKSDDPAVPEDLLTEPKLLDRPREKETKHDSAAKSMSKGLENDNVAPVAVSSAAGDDVAIDRTAALANGGPLLNQEASDKAEVGLGISDLAIIPASEEVTKAKKKKKKPKKTKKPKADITEASEQCTPTAESKALMYRFGEGNTAPTAQVDDRSEASSHTAAGDSATPDLASPKASTPGRKLPLVSPGNGHLLEPKTKSYIKARKRIASGKPSEPAAETSTGERLYVVSTVSDSDESEQTSQSGSATPSSEAGKKQERMFVYLGNGKGDEGERDLPAIREELQKLARERIELKAAHGDMSQVEKSALLEDLVR
ncbi:hypothetical protein LTR37_019196 [Vermiconidia calcicola]|uniref:Uncharacterized protein n=1 Tax=Vermiconidia calcicola TaxID=1690605 RepID=A0ACC3MFY8_9PEZI|nr:hypothetical protein LTR37_019196 [Vermiconidia calcicola]